MKTIPLGFSLSTSYRSAGVRSQVCTRRDAEPFSFIYKILLDPSPIAMGRRVLVVSIGVAIAWSRVSISEKTIVSFA